MFHSLFSIVLCFLIFECHQVIGAVASSSVVSDAVVVSKVSEFGGSIVDPPNCSDDSSKTCCRFTATTSSMSMGIDTGRFGTTRFVRRIAAEQLRESLFKQNESVVRAHRPPKRSRVNGVCAQKGSSSAYESSKSSKSIVPGSPGYSLRVGVAGGIAGATGTAVLYPIDSAKTVRQSNPKVYKSVRQALWSLCYDKTRGKWHVQRAYKGLIPATLGAIPSSALYFGSYETMKSLIRRNSKADPTTSAGRLWVHALSAASGNIISSAIFVPKEVIKQQMQCDGANTIWGICKRRGIRGLYAGYSATLMRNIPSAILRFALYEEIKYRWHTSAGDEETGGFNPKLFAAGALAGAMASGFMTPIDVLKTRISTGTCPVPSDSIPACIQFVVRDQGWGALYAGGGSRMLFSAAFSAIGFGMLEATKGWLGVSDRALLKGTSSTHGKELNRHNRNQEVSPCSRPQRSLGDAIRNDAQKTAARLRRWSPERTIKK